MDSKNRVTQTTQNGRTQKYVYNGQSQITQIVDALARTTNLTYNAQNELTRIIFPSADTLRFSYTYLANDTRISSTYYQADDTLLSTRIALRDADTQLLTNTFLESTAQSVDQYQYNTLEELTQMTSTGQFGTSATQYSYDQEGRLNTVVDGLNGLTQFTYDLLDRLTQVTAANGANTSYKYSAWGEMLQLVSSDTGSTLYELDSSGNIVNQTNANNQTAVYQYDAQNRPITIAYLGGDLDVSLTYDQGLYGQGRLTNYSDGSGSSYYQYNDRGLVIQANIVIADTPLSIGYEYNNTNQLTQTVYPSGASVAISYDSAGRLADINLTQQGASTSQTIINNIQWYDTRPKSFEYGNNLITTLNYDNAGRLVGKQFGSAAEQQQNQLDNQGNITQQQWTEANANDTSLFTYDKLGRLTRMALS